MGIYSNMTTNYYGTSQELNECEAQVFPESMDILECTFQTLVEAEENWNIFRKAVGLNELNCLVSTGEEYIYEAGGAASFLENAKQWFVKLFQKIKGIFEKFIAKVASFVSSDAKFVNKYEDKIREGSNKIPASTTFNGYMFEGLKKFNIKNYSGMLSSDNSKGDALLKTIKSINTATISAASDNGAINDDKLKKQLEEFRNGSEAGLKSLRGNMCGQSTGLESGEFAKEFRDYLYGDKESLDDSYLSKYTEFIAEIKEAKQCKAKAKEDFDEIKKLINENISRLESYKQDLKDKDNSQDNDKSKKAKENLVKYIDATINSAKEGLTVFTTANGIHLAALKDYNRQCKAICVKLVGFASRQSAENASAIYQNEYPALGSLNFI